MYSLKVSKSLTIFKKNAIIRFMTTWTKIPNNVLSVIAARRHPNISVLNDC